MADFGPSACPVDPCGQLRTPGCPMCARHMLLMGRALRCALRRAWHDHDTELIRKLSQRAVDDVQTVIDHRGDTPTPGASVAAGQPDRGTP